MVVESVTRPAATTVVGMAFQIVASPDGLGRRFTYVSQSCLELNGVPAEEAMADPRRLYELIDPEHWPRVAEAERVGIDTHTPVSVQAPFRRPDGGQRWCQITAAPHRLPDGSVAWDGIQLDITEQRNNQRRLELALEAGGLGLWEYNIPEDQLFWTARMRTLFGVPPEAPLSFAAFEATIHPEDLHIVLEGYRSALTPQGGDFGFEHRVVWPNGVIRWVLSRGRVIGEGGVPKLAIGISLDITDRREAEDIRVLLLGELNHRVKNDFQIVSGLLDLQAHRVEDPAARAELEKAQRRVAGIARAHQNLYADASRSVVEMDHYLSSICRDLEDGLFTDAPAALTWRIDPCRLGRDRAVAVGLIVNELVTNAVKHALRPDRSGAVQVTLEMVENCVQLTVCDDGPGLPDDYGESKGLGRNLINAFAKQAGGGIEILEGPGARIHLKLEL